MIYPRLEPRAPIPRRRFWSIWRALWDTPRSWKIIAFLLLAWLFTLLQLIEARCELVVR